MVVVVAVVVVMLAVVVAMAVGTCLASSLDLLVCMALIEDVGLL